MVSWYDLLSLASGKLDLLSITDLLSLVSSLISRLILILSLSHRQTSHALNPFGGLSSLAPVTAHPLPLQLCLTVTLHLSDGKLEGIVCLIWFLFLAFHLISVSFHYKFMFCLVFDLICYICFALIWFHSLLIIWNCWLYASKLNVLLLQYISWTFQQESH